jgi:SAM-dependent methyltransferase
MQEKRTPKWYLLLDKLFLKEDKGHIRRSKNIRLIPEFAHRRGGKLAYAEWAQVIGIFQTLFYQQLARKTGNHILDIGCGTGLLGISAEPYTQEGGSYTGIDILPEDIAYCKRHYTQANYSFIHLDAVNRSYVTTQSTKPKPWPVQSGYYDLVTGLSVWTHFNEADSRYYFKEVSRVLKSGGKAIITFFFLDEAYEETVDSRSAEAGHYHFIPQSNLIFSEQAYNSKHWLHPKPVNFPEDAIGITPEGMELMASEAGLKVHAYFPGNWKEKPGVFYQDVLVFEKV